MLKKITFLLLFSFGCMAVNAQMQIDTVPPYKKDNRLPAFKIMQIDNTWLTKEQLPKSDFTVIIYFSPDCGHCQHEVKEIVKNIDKFKKVNFVWASYRSIPEIKEFYNTYGLNKYPNMFMGRDPDYKLPSFYRVKFTPFVAVYDKKGRFIKAFEQGAEMHELLPLVNHK